MKARVSGRSSYIKLLLSPHIPAKAGIQNWRRKSDGLNLLRKASITSLLAFCATACSPPPSREEATAAIRDIIDADDIPCEIEINGVGFGEGDDSNGYFLTDIRVRGGETKFTRVEVLFQKAHIGDDWIITNAANTQLLGTVKQICDSSLDE